MVAVCHGLDKRSESPVLLVQGRKYADFLGSFPTAPFPYCADLSAQEREVLRSRLERYALMSKPAVLLEDTHPSGIEFSNSVRRILLVRPLLFSEMMNLL